MTAPVHGRLGADLALIEADPPLAALHARAGGAPGGVLAVPQLAQVARLAKRLRVAVSRGVVAADDERDLALWVRAAPDGEGVRLAIVAWTERPAALGPPADEIDWLRAEAELVWETDAALLLTVFRPAAPAPGLLGTPLTRAFGLRPAADGALPLVEAMAERRAFADQPADLRGGGAVMLAGRPLLDGAGRFCGFRGTATHRAPEPAADAFGTRLGAALKAPLDRIIALADAIGSGDAGALRGDYAGYAEDIAGASRHLLGLVDDLVDLSAIERADYRPVPEPLDLADLARRAAGLLRLRALHRDVTIAAPDEAETIPAAGEYRRVLQILVNLVGNAVRYAPPGSVVRLHGGSDGGIARLAVADEGRGIAPVDHARIFERFERVDPAEPGTTGLGLYIARRLARAMHGDLAVDSAPGEGARFTLTLPAE